MARLTEILDKNTVPGDLCEKTEGNDVRCFACGHRCLISEGARGVCKVRFNQGGILRVPHGYVAGAQSDPIEKKPFFHVRPGALAFSFGMLGCNFHCDYCQNWLTSQTLRDPNSMAPLLEVTPGNLVETACRQGAEIIVSTYNEPLITTEWASSVFKEAQKAGLLTGYVSNGYASPEALQYLRPYLDLYKVDLKSFDDLRYRQLGGRLQPILDAIRSLYEMGIWLEIVTLLVPGFNDSREELKELTEFISGISADIPWHVTAFHKNYQMTDPDNTTLEDLMKAVEIGKNSGLKYVYAGNLPGKLRHGENTYCPDCHELLIERYGYRIMKYKMASRGICSCCGHKIPGRWTELL
jgi:pyruvate formate lyase activating enzyme